MAELKLTQEQMNKNTGMFIHEDLFLGEVKKLEDAIDKKGGESGGVTMVNGKIPDSNGLVTINASEIMTTGSSPVTVEVSLNKKAEASDVDALTTEVQGKASQQSLNSLNTTVQTMENKFDNYILKDGLATDPTFKSLVDRVAALEAGHAQP